MTFDTWNWNNFDHWNCKTNLGACIITSLGDRLGNYHLVIFFLPANWWNANTSQSHSSSSIQSLLTCGLPHLWKKISQLCGGVRAPYFMFEGGNLLNLNLTPVTNTPLKTLQLHKLCDSVTEPSLPTSVRFIYYFVFEETVCNFAFAYYNLHFVCAQKKADLAVPAWNLLLNCFCMVLVLSLLALLGWCNL